MSRKIKETYHRLGELLVRKGVVKPHEIDAALAVQRAHIAERRSPPKLGEILIERNVLTKKLIREILDEQKIGRGEKRHLSIGLRESGGLAVVVLQGRLDETSHASVTRILERLMNRGFAKVAVDCLIWSTSTVIASPLSSPISTRHGSGAAISSSLEWASTPGSCLTGSA